MIKKNKIIFTLILALIVLKSDTSFAQSAKTKNIIIVTVDGVRWNEVFKGADSSIFFDQRFNTQDSLLRYHKYWSSDIKVRKKKLLPFFWNTIANKGQLYGNRDIGNYVNVRNTYWFSYPGYSEILTGYFDPKINSNEYPNNPGYNILEFIDQQRYFHKKVVAFASWRGLARILNRNRNGLLVNVPYENIEAKPLTELQVMTNEIQHYTPKIFGQSIRLDGNTYVIAKTYIMAHHPRVIYLEFAVTDHFAHERKYDFYLDAIHYVDRILSDLWKTVQTNSFYKDKTTILISPDHGRGYGKQWTSHSASIPHSNETWLAIMGPDTPPLGVINTKTIVYQDQYAQTIADFLGLHFTADHPIGKLIESARTKKQIKY